MKATRVAEDELRFAKNRERERTFARSLGWLGCLKQVAAWRWWCDAAGWSGWASRSRFSLGLRAKKFALPREPQKLGYTRWWRGLSSANDRSPKTRQGDFLHVYLKRVDGGGSAI